MNSLVIQNKGLVDPHDLCLIGSSTKRNDDTKIGMFGSGWKYALAWLLRNEIDIKIFSGTTEIVIDYDIVLHRDKPVRVLTVDGKQTSITAEMGPQWTGWMAIREIVSNAIDEGEYQLNTLFNAEFKGIDENTTAIYIPLNNELQNVIRNYEHYFAFDRKATHTNDIGSVYLKSEVSAINIYRKGIRCFDITNKSAEVYQSKLDFNFNTISINESRVTDWYEITSETKHLIRIGVPAHILLEAIKEDKIPSSPSNHNCEEVKLLVEQGYKFVSTIEAMVNNLTGNDLDSVALPDTWYKELVTRGIITSNVNIGNILYVETNKLNLNEVDYHLKGIGLNNIKLISGTYANGYNDVRLLDNYTVLFRDTLQNTPKQLAVAALRVLSEDIVEQIFK